MAERIPAMRTACNTAEIAIANCRACRLNVRFVIQLRQHVADLLPALVAGGGLLFDFLDDLFQPVLLRIEGADEALAEVLLRSAIAEGLQVLADALLLGVDGVALLLQPLDFLLQAG